MIEKNFDRQIGKFVKHMAIIDHIELSISQESNMQIFMLKAYLKALHLFFKIKYYTCVSLILSNHGALLCKSRK